MGVARLAQVPSEGDEKGAGSLCILVRALRDHFHPSHHLVPCLSKFPVAGMVWSRADFTGGAGHPPRLCQDGKRKLTESSREFPKGSTWQSPEGALREVREGWTRPFPPLALQPQATSLHPNHHRLPP